jgi:hypothetical protein
VDLKITDNDGVYLNCAYRVTNRLTMYFREVKSTPRGLSRARIRASSCAGERFVNSRVSAHNEKLSARQGVFATAARRLALGASSRRGRQARRSGPFNTERSGAAADAWLAKMAALIAYSPRTPVCAPALIVAIGPYSPTAREKRFRAFAVRTVFFGFKTRSIS